MYLVPFCYHLGEDNKANFIPQTIGKYTCIGRNCVVESACIGVGCNIGDDAVLCERSILKDYVRVEPGTVVPPDMVIPPFCIVAGKPGRIVGELSSANPSMMEAKAFARFQNFTEAPSKLV